MRSSYGASTTTRSSTSLRFGRERGVEVRFIEFMPLDGDGQWSLDRVVPAGEIIDRVDAVYPLVPAMADGTPKAVPMATSARR